MYDVFFILNWKENKNYGNFVGKDIIDVFKYFFYGVGVIEGLLVVGIFG